jgi:hypothetical protein
MTYTEKVKFSSTGNYGCGPEDEDDVYTIKEFIELVECGGFIDSDGIGYPVKDNKRDPSIWISPSGIHEIPKDATHIVWYNK